MRIVYHSEILKLNLSFQQQKNSMHGTVEPWELVMSCAVVVDF